MEMLNNSPKFAAPNMTLCTLVAAAMAACGGGTTETGAAIDVTMAAALQAAPQTEPTTDADALRIRAKATNTTKVATEGGSFSLTGMQTVRYGADSRWIQKLVTGSAQCTNGFFGSDPAVGTLKSCELITVNATPPPPSPTPAPATSLATEGGTFSVGGTQTVRYGAGSRWVQKLVTGSGDCTNGFFGSDPAPGTVKFCELSAVAAPSPAPGPAPTPTTTLGPAPAPASAPAPSAPSITAWVRLALENEVFTATGSQTVRFGDGTRWLTKQVSGEGQCTRPYFGADPAPGAVKFCEVQRTVPSVTQSGTTPVVNTGLMPTATKGFSAPRVRTLGASELAMSVFQPTPSDSGAFREPCTFSHMAFDDPIVYPNRAGASHLHTFFGNSQLNAASTGDSLMNAGDSTCMGGTLNRSAYWIPTLIDIRTGQPLVADGALFYYKTGYLGVRPGTIQAFPKGLRIIAGNSSNAAPHTSPYMRLECSSGFGGHNPSIPSCPVGNSLTFVVVFPQCWDGINLDSPDHNSHMAYGSGAGCPSSHPVPLPEITINVHYTITEANSGAFLRLSSDQNSLPGGYSLHADWFNGWDNGVNKTFVGECVNKNIDCHAQLLGDGRILY